MTAAMWVWIEDSLTIQTRYYDGSWGLHTLNTPFTEAMCQRLGIAAPSLRLSYADYSAAKTLLNTALNTLRKHPSPLQILDYILAFSDDVNSTELNGILQRSRSRYEVGKRGDHKGLVRRVPLGVKQNADDLFPRVGQSGVRLSKAWEALYGVTPDASKAYGLAIKAVEDAAVPLIFPDNSSATLGTLIRQMRDQSNWSLPISREPDDAGSGDVVLSLMKLLWSGQHDRHGGQPSAPRDVSFDEAQVAVSIAVNLVQIFAAGLVQRRPANT